MVGPVESHPNLPGNPGQPAGSPQRSPAGQSSWPHAQRGTYHDAPKPPDQSPDPITAAACPLSRSLSLWRLSVSFSLYLRHRRRRRRRLSRSKDSVAGRPGLFLRIIYSKILLFYRAGRAGYLRSCSGELDAPPIRMCSPGTQLESLGLRIPSVPAFFPG